MRPLVATFVNILAVSLAACAPVARAPASGRVNLPSAFANAFRLDMTSEPAEAVQAYLEIVNVAARAEGDVWQVPTIEAALDALVEREMPLLGGAAPDAALERRSPESRAIADALSHAESVARGPFAKGLIARALMTLAQRSGDTHEADLDRRESGCAREALVIGPVTWAPVTGVHDPSPLDRVDARIEPSYNTGGAFESQVRPIAVGGRGCAIELDAESAHPGVREVVVDVAIPRSERIGVVLRSHGAAEIRASGRVILERPFELGDGEAARFARVAVSNGTARFVVRAGTA